MMLLLDGNRQIMQWGDQINDPAAVTLNVLEADVPAFRNLMAQPGVKTLNADNTISVTPPAATPPAPDVGPARNAVVNQAQSAVGVKLSDLTAAQKLALVACLLFLADAIDPATLTIRPLNQWLRLS